MFIFKLQSVLEYRKNIEEKILNEFSGKKRELEREKLILKNLIAERVGLINELRRMKNKLLPVDDLTRYVTYVEQVRQKEGQQNRVVTEVREEFEVIRMSLLEAVKKSKVMEKLKERHKEEYESTARIYEQTNSDEMAVLKFGRREK